MTREPPRILVPVLLLVVICLQVVQIRQQNRIADNYRALVEQGVPSPAGPSAAPPAPAPTRSNYRPPAPEPGTSGGTLNSYLLLDLDSFNPITAKYLNSYKVLTQVFEPLYFPDPVTCQVAAVLACGHEVQEAGKVWIVHLRDDVTWSDGERFDADDVLFTFEVMLSSGIQSYSSREFEYQVGEDRVPIKVEKLDPFTVKFTQPIPYFAFREKLAGKMIIPEHRLRRVFAEGAFQSHWGVGTPDLASIVGTGPFRLAEYVKGSRIVLAKRPGYWRRDAALQPEPYLDRIVIDLVDSFDTALLEFRSGELDSLADIPGAALPLVRDLEKQGRAVVIDAGPNLDFQYLMFNQNERADPGTGKPYVDPAKREWFREPRFRRAVALAIDRDAIIENVFNGLAQVNASPYPRMVPFHHPGLPITSYDPDQARAELTGLGMIDRDHDGIREDQHGVRVSFALSWSKEEPEFEGIVGIVTDRLRDVGIEARPVLTDRSTLSRKLFSTYDWEAMLSRDSGAYYEPKGDDPLWSSNGDYHLWNPRQERPSTPWEARIDEIFRLASFEFDTTRRHRLLFELQEIIARELPIIFLGNRERLFARKPELGNFRPAAPEPSQIWNSYELFLRR
ncbi:MAG: ABC transporter substrate-binding protein [Planctomycetota bacterium]